ncbi:MAG: 3'-5' exonuclease [Lentisphaeria bacterium]|nr:3'-5' exonuclease [Lentisphaeria bacterium]
MNIMLDTPLVVFDLETTGVNPRADRIVEFAAIKVSTDGTEETLHLLINPERAIPKETSDIHGISDADVRDAPTFAQVAAQIAAFMQGSDLAGFGILRFDVPLLTREFADAGRPDVLKGARLVDALTIFHRHEPRNLSAALRLYCGKDLVDAHSALADTRASLEVLEGQLARYQDLPRDVAGLDQFCNPKDPDAIDPEGKLRWQGGEAVIAFGQKRGMTLRQLAADEPGYLRWILKKDFSDEIKTVVQQALDGVFPTRSTSSDG